MNTDNGALSFDAYINNSDFKRHIDEMNARIKGLSSSTVKETKKMDDAFNGVGKAMLALGGTAIFVGLARQIVNVTGEFQKLDIAFTTMLGSKEKANALMAQIVDTAAKTPFTLQEVAQGAKQLLAYQVAADKVNETVIRLGNISAGVGVPLGQLVAVYGQVKAKGKLQGDDMKQFMNAGIPIVAELAKVMGKADEQVQQLVTDGKVGFADVQKVIERLTDKGGMFFNLMEEQSKTLSGQISNLQDAWDRMLNKIGQGNDGLISGVIGGATFAVEHYEDILDAITPLIAAYGSYKAVVMATAAAQKAAALWDNIKLISMFRKELGLATAAQQAFNTASKANVVGLAIAAVAGLATVIYNYASAVKTAADLQEEFNSLVEDSEKYEGNVKMIDRYDELSKVQNRTNEEQDEYNKLIDDLSKVYPDAIEKIDEHGRIIELNTGKLKEYNDEQKEALKLVAADQLKETEKAIERIQSKLARAREETSPTKQKYLPGFENQPGQWITVDRPGDERASAAKKVLELTDELQKLKQLQDDLQIQLGIKLKVVTEDENGNDSNKDLKYTVAEQINKINKELGDAEKKLKALRLKTSFATPEDIETQEKVIKDLEKQLELLTGIKKSKKEITGKKDEQPISAISPISSVNIKTPKLAKPNSKDILASYYTGSLSSDMNKLFSDLDNLTVREMLRIKKHIEDNFQNLNLNPDELEALRSRIDEATDEIGKRNPFAALGEAIKEYQKDESNVNLKKVFEGIGSSINLVKGSFDAVIGGIESMGIAMDESTMDMLKNIGSLMDGAANLAMGIASSNPLAIIQGSISLISAGVNAIFGSHDKAADRSIKQHEEAVRRLQNAYNELSWAIDKALGKDLYKSQQEAISNLKQQQFHLQKMWKDEQDKKKTDSSKVAQYKEQYAEIGRQIQDMLDGISRDIVQTDAKSLADSLGDALVAAFKRGEDAATAFNDVVNEVVKNAILNQLKKNFLEKQLEGAVSSLEQSMGTWSVSDQRQAEIESLKNQIKALEAKKQGNAWIDPAISKQIEILKAKLAAISGTDQFNFDGLSAEEIEAFKEQIGNVTGPFNEALKAYSEIFKDLAETPSLSGAISATVTEETATLLSGYINAIRINQIESTSVLKNQLLVLNQISTNTGYNINLTKLNDILDVLNKMASSGSLRGFGL